MITFLCAFALSLLSPAEDTTGVVVDTDGKAIAGATVFIVHPTDQDKDVSTQTNAEGIFTFAQIATSDPEPQFLVWKDGYAAGFHRVKQQQRSFQLELGKKQSDEIRIELKPPTLIQPTIVDPDGMPVGGAKVTPVYFGEGSDYVYRESGLPDVTATTSDTHGRVVLKGLATGRGLGFYVETEEFGRQRFGRSASKDQEPKKIAMSKTGSLRGRIVCDSDGDLTGWQIDLRSANQDAASDDPETLTVIGGTSTVSKADGSFEIPHLTIGSFRGNVYHKSLKQYSADIPVFEVTADNAAELEIKLKTLRRAFGKIVEKNSDRPVAGVKLILGRAITESDMDGFFEGYVEEPPTYISIRSAPDGYVLPEFDTRPVTIKDPDAGELDLGTFAVTPATLITGVVKDEAGTPQAGVNVIASWVQISEGKNRSYGWRNDTAVTDHTGRYQILNSPNDVRLLLDAIGIDLALKQPQQLAIDDSREVNLTVGRENTAYLLAVVKTVEGEPIPGAAVRISQSCETIDYGSMGGRGVRIHGEEVFAANDAGIVRTPIRIPRSGKYSLAISADGYLPLSTDYLQLGGTDDEVRFGEFQLQRARSASGTIQDSAGNPVAGVTVSAHGIPASPREEQPVVSVQTDAAGHFSLSALHPATSVVTVRGEGLRPTGAAIPSDKGEISITVLRTDEAIPDSQRVRIPHRREDRVAAGRKLLDQMMLELRGSNYFDSEALALLSQVRPESIPDELAKTTSASARVKALVTLKEYEEANSQVEQIESGYSRAFARFGIIDNCDDNDQKLQFIAAALIDGKSVQEPDNRAVILAGVAERLTAIGQQEQSHKLLMESLEQFKQLPSKDWAGFAKGFFAERLARYEFDTAIALLDGMEPDKRARHVGNIAHALAAFEPEKVEKIISESDATRSLITHRIRVCYRMAPVDLERAERIRQGHPDNHSFVKEHCLGVMAMAICDQNPDRAKQLLQQAWTELQATTNSRQGSREVGDYRFGVALALLSYAESIDPDSLTDSFWRTIAFYPGPKGDSVQVEKQQIEDIERQAMLVLAFGLYDREPEMCQQMMQPAFEYWSQKEHLQNHDFYRKNATFAAMAIANPERSVQWAIDAYKAMPAESRRLIPQPWLTIGKTLCSEPKAIHDMLAEEVFHRWFIDKYDM